MVNLTCRSGIVVAAFLMSLLSISPAIAQIDPGVQQSAAQTANVSGTVMDAAGHVVAGADVKLQGQITLATRTDARGAFSFASAPYGPYQIIVTSSTLGNASQRIELGSDVTVTVSFAGAKDVKTIGRVSTAGSGAHINVTAASIASVQPGDFAMQGNTQWRRLIEGVPGVTVGGGLSGGGSTIVNIPDSPLQPEILSINGALPYETGTTIDGMPIYSLSFGASPGNGVDLSILPMSAFDTADIVRGPGANSPSILDSVGGSFVLHAPGRVAKNQFDISSSTDAYGGSVTNVRAKVRAGHLSATLVYGLNVSPGPEGFKPSQAVYFAHPSTVNGVALAGGGLVSSAQSPNYQGVYNYNDTIVISGYPEDSSWVDHTGGIGLSYDVSPNVTASAFYAGHSASMNQATFFYPFNFVPGTGYTGSVAPGFHNDIFYALPPNVNAESSGLFEERVTANIGKGVLRLAALQSNSDVLQYIPQMNPGTFGLFGTVNYASAPAVPVTFSGQQVQLTFPASVYFENTQVYNRDLLASYETQIGNDSTAGVSFVKSYVGYQDYENNSGTLALQPPGISQGTNELRFHLSHTFAPGITVDLSDYVLNGSFHEPNPTNRATWVDVPFNYSAPRLGIAWAASKDAVVRASAGGGIAIPPLSYLNGTNSISSCSAVTGMCSQTITNLNLKPETSFAYDLGADIRVQHDTVISGDIYRTNLNGQIFSSVSYAGMNPMFNLPIYAKEYLNLGKSRFEGINLAVHHDVAKGFMWDFGLGLTRGYVVSVPNGFYNSSGAACNFTTGVNCTNTYIVPYTNYDGKFQSTVPYANGRATIGYRWSPQWSVDIQPTYFGNNNAYFRPGFVEFDAHASVGLSKYVTLSATFRNITGIYDQNYATLYGTVTGAPTVVGAPYGLTELPYGPRTAIVTANIKL